MGTSRFPRGIVWFRRDLRVHDHTALEAALSECREVTPVFVFDEPLLASHIFGSACISFMLSCLNDLSQSLAEVGLQLHWRRGDPAEELPKAARDFRTSAVYWNRDYEPGAISRDEAVANALRRQKIEVRTFKDHVVFEADEVHSAAGDPFQRYGPYRTRWWSAWRSAPPPVVPSRTLLRIRRSEVPVAIGERPSANDLGYQTVPPSVQGGEHAAWRRLRAFLRGPIGDYATGRNYPAIGASSMLSPHFRFGTLSVRSAVHAALAVLRRRGPAWHSGVQTWVDELIWRDFFQQILASFPHVATGPFRTTTTGKVRRPPAAAFTAWCEGRTGFPLIDAGMRQLNQTGWMHNRVRMVVASFLIKDLRLDWQIGERYFMENLLDADLAANNGNWQWCASTGTDAMPGYRIFNPATQARKFDPEGSYIRRYIPELASVPVAFIHTPEAMSVADQDRSRCRLGIDYPLPMVDHKEASQTYLAGMKTRRTSR